MKATYRQIEVLKALAEQGRINRAEERPIWLHSANGEQLTPNIEAWLQTKAQKLLETQLKVIADVSR